jgi:hypothetical protein
MRKFTYVFLVLSLAAIACETALAADRATSSLEITAVSGEVEAVGGESVTVANTLSSDETLPSVSFTAVSYDIGVVGNRVTVWANLSPSGASFDNWTVSFKIESAEIATASFDAISGDRARIIITGRAPGAASVDLIMASTDGVASFDATCTVHVRPVPVTGVYLDVHEKTFYEGYRFTLAARVLPDNATNKTLEWVSSSEDIVSAAQFGGMKCLRAGTANIIASAEGKFDICKITVKANPVWLDEGDAVKVLPKGASFDEGDGTIIWSNLNDAFEEPKVILRNNDLYGYHITGLYGYEECGEFKNGWRARIVGSSTVTVEFDKNEDEVKGEIGIIIISNGAGYMPGADKEKHITVKFAGKNENKNATGCNAGFWLIAIIIILKLIAHCGTIETLNNTGG